MAHYQELMINNSHLLNKKDLNAFKWLYWQCVEVDRDYAGEGLKFLLKYKRGCPITSQLVDQIRTLLPSINPSILEGWIGYQKYLTRWCTEKRPINYVIR